jgi:hypothetical protein
MTSLIWKIGLYNFDDIKGDEVECKECKSAGKTSSEQLFSAANDVFDYRRSRLSAKLAEQLIFLNHALTQINFRY